ncbi:Glutamyl-tRNA(Gln) amidotransferase subunit C [Pseudobythopirellula maris]|uniref:Aspartyl/glutamyl-tRNA(Asn/Gln) amidotransferase subunit C n=1 Tax=Pseudobythopirellula maris TaxID=2527991 RepID=A0A5C5ZRH4_9BACT|nr:Asp-tRNA(Asn)/Glu-tRNA(Gln) amidotransferase subunit GatC [Pseudobythopirellula maris]TWT89685.1 Glutamyl-tRNA(Gln) amidotransferase subunit C [Pseudobythopirellula maris]
MAISRADVEKASLLGRLILSDQELDELAPQLAEVVAYVDQLSEVDTEGVEPMAHAVELVNVLRDDEPREGLSREAALANAPKHNGVGFLVPAVLGD